MTADSSADPGARGHPVTAGRPAEHGRPAGSGGVHVLGVRHHGPGSARAVADALAKINPDAVLIEGPSDAAGLLGFASAPEAIPDLAADGPDPAANIQVAAGLVPPVALLAYDPKDPALWAVWPFAHFSPEWVALTWAHRNARPVEFCDLPAPTVLAQRADADSTDPGPGDSDPLTEVAALAGYADPERWWDAVVENSHGHDLFDCLADAIGQLRELSVPAHQDLVREAYMRNRIRAARKTYPQIAVVCGGWHAPALRSPLPPAAADTRLLAGLPKRKATLTWIPWTHSRMADSSGYGAGVRSPGWYAHLYSTPELPVPSWLTRVAHALRAKDLPTSTAHVIEATRLAQTLAGIRGRAAPGLDEVTEATLAVLCDGDESLLAYVTAELVVGEVMGAVPEGAPAVPLEADLAASARRLRLPREPVAQTKDLDLRKETDAARSRLLHRLALLDVPWGRLGTSRVRATGTFRETWELQWPPELAMLVIEAAPWGATVRTAATHKVRDDALAATLPTLTGLVERCLHAALPDALDDLLAALRARAAQDHDVSALMASLPPLVRSLRYGDVRGTDAESLELVVQSLIVRICVGLPPAMGNLDDDAAQILVGELESVHGAIALLDSPDATTWWLDMLESASARADVHPRLAGRLTRLLSDMGRFDADQASARVARALSVGSTPEEKAWWVEGFLAGGAQLLIHDPVILGLLNEWIVELGEDDFVVAAPLLRRTFGQMSGPERRQIGLGAQSLGRAGGRSTAAWDHAIWDDATGDEVLGRVQPALSTVLRLLGVPPAAPARPDRPDE